MKFTKSSIIYFLLVFVPISVILDLVHADHLIIFIIAVIALIPLAKLIGDSTEHLSTHYGSTLISFKCHLWQCSRNNNCSSSY